MKNPLENELSDEMLDGVTGGVISVVPHPCNNCGGKEFIYRNGMYYCLSCGHEKLLNE